MRVDLDELERLEKAAFYGPWIHVPRLGIHVMNRSILHPKDKWVICLETPADAELITVTRNAMPAIIAELRAARECVEYLERILDTDAVRNENEELDGEASAVLLEWKKATKGDG